MTTTAAVSVPCPEYGHVGYDYGSHKLEDIISKWKEIRSESSFVNLLDYSVEEIEKRVDKLYSFVNLHKDKFIIKRGPVSDDIFENHFKKHYSDLNILLSERTLRPEDALGIAKYIYLYDCVYPHLSEDTIMLRDYPKESMKVLVIPNELYNWMVRLDYLWFKLLIKKSLNRSILEYLEENHKKFVSNALKLRTFLPIPPKKLRKKHINIEEMFKRAWFRGTKVYWEYIVEVFYRETLDSFIYVFE